MRHRAGVRGRGVSGRPPPVFQTALCRVTASIWPGRCFWNQPGAISCDRAESVHPGLIPGVVDEVLSPDHLSARADCGLGEQSAKQPPLVYMRRPRRFKTDTRRSGLRAGSGGLGCYGYAELSRRPLVSGGCPAASTLKRPAAQAACPIPVCTERTRRRRQYRAQHGTANTAPPVPLVCPISGQAGGLGPTR